MVRNALKSEYDHFGKDIINITVHRGSQECNWISYAVLYKATVSHVFDLHVLTYSLTHSVTLTYSLTHSLISLYLGLPIRLSKASTPTWDITVQAVASIRADGYECFLPQRLLGNE